MAVRRGAATILIASITASSLVAGCGSNGDREPTRVATPADAPTQGYPEFPRTARPQQGPGSGGAPVVFTDVRTAPHAGFDRIVLEFSGAGRPGWVVSYVDKAVLDGSGDAVTLGGGSTLDIYASHTTWPAPGYYSGPARLRPEKGGISEVYVGGTFEGTTQVLAGIKGSRTPFRVFALTHPSRLVVDVEQVD